jgi:hypothetical protein
MKKLLTPIGLIILLVNSFSIIAVSEQITLVKDKPTKTIDILFPKKETNSNDLNMDEDFMLIVISPSEFASELDSLITHKNARGISCKQVILDEIYQGEYFPVQGRDDAEKIKYFIKDTIENWGTSFVLLVGGSETLPIRTVKTVYSFVSDLYYADIYNATGGFCSWDANGNDKFGEYMQDGLDIYPDVHLGRLPCVDESQVETCVNKIIIYEEEESYKKDWFRNLVVCGGDTLAPPLYPNHEMAEGEVINQAVIDVMSGFTPEKIWASNGRLSGDNPSGVDAINQAFNAGCGFVDMAGEGNTFGWATHPIKDSETWLPTPTPGGYYKSNVPNLTNAEKLPIVVIGACKTHKFEDDADCFGWKFLTSPNGGAIATFGTTTFAVDEYGQAPDSYTSKFELNLFKAYKPQGAITVGEMWSKAVASYVSSDMDKEDYLTLEEWVLFGDPSLSIADTSQEPLKPEKPSGPTSGVVNTKYTYTTSTTDPENDELYYLFDWGDGSFSGWQGPYSSGEDFSSEHTWTSKGDYGIRVRVKDEHGMMSEWSDTLPISMPRNKILKLRLIESLERLLKNSNRLILK